MHFLVQYNLDLATLLVSEARTATEMDRTLHTDFRKAETSRGIKKKLTSFEHL